MVDRPIIFSGSMVRALLDGRKTMTRRIIKPQPNLAMKGVGGNWVVWDGLLGWRDIHEAFSDPALKQHKLRFAVGDRLYVRENFALHPQSRETVFYKATVENEPGFPVWSGPWRPSIHLPRSASRLTLIVEAVKVERLQDISEVDAKAEGIHRYPHHWHDPEYPLDPIAYEPFAGAPERYSDPVEAYQALWNSINGPNAWDANPWVVAVSFRVVKANIDSKEAA